MNANDQSNLEHINESREEPVRDTVDATEIAGNGQGAGSNGDIDASNESASGPNKIPGVASYGVAFRSKMNSTDSGEDGYCMELLSDGRLLMAVADGVGRWRDKGVNPSLFANGLLSLVIEEANNSESNCLPQIILSNAFRRLVAMNNTGEIRTPGSSTACVVIVHPGRLELANLGDSGVVVFRENLVIFRSQPQQFTHNCPFQISIDPQKKRCDDMTVHVETYSLPLQKGDVIIVATDGLFDNVFDEDINWVIGNNQEAQTIANNLLITAHSRAQSEDIHTPYSDEVNRHYPHYEGGFMGGKRDDITILVCVI